MKLRSPAPEMYLGWRALRHRRRLHHPFVPRWLWWYQWEFSGVWLCATCLDQGYAP